MAKAVRFPAKTRLLAMVTASGVIDIAIYCCTEEKMINWLMYMQSIEYIQLQLPFLLLNLKFSEKAVPIELEYNSYRLNEISEKLWCPDKRSRHLGKNCSETVKTRYETVEEMMNNYWQKTSWFQYTAKKKLKSTTKIGSTAVDKTKQDQ